MDNKTGRLLLCCKIVRNNHYPIDTKPIEKAIETSFGKMPIHVTQIDQNGFSEYTKSQSARTAYHKKRFSLSG